MTPGKFSDFLARLRGTASSRDHARFAAVIELNRVLAAATDRRDVLSSLLDEAVELFRAERGFLLEVDGDGYRVALARNLDREPIKNPGRKISSTIVARCIKTREGSFVEDAQGELGAAQSVADMHLRSVLCAPLIAGGRCYGCLYLDHRFHTAVFGPDDLPWAQALADQGAIALRLYELLAIEAERNATIARENRELAATLVERETQLAEIQADFDRANLEHDYREIVGESPALLRFLRMLDRVAAVDFAVLLVGESGTGKELAARAIHANSRRAAGRFVPVNVASVNPAILESELFGHVQGAYTGADNDRPGLIRHAAGGVLFLDEVTEMPLEMQVKLLRFLEDHRVRPVGSDATDEVDLRVVAATNRDPQQAVAEGELREDLYYRLSAMTVTVPALRERLSDIPLLVDAFLAAAANERGGKPCEVDPRALDALRRRSWPGNLRQLRNELFRLDALAPDGIISPGAVTSNADIAATRTSLNLRELEQWAIAEALRATGGNKAEGARLLGISRRALYNKLGRAES